MRAHVQKSVSLVPHLGREWWQGQLGKSRLYSSFEANRVNINYVTPTRGKSVINNRGRKPRRNLKEWTEILLSSPSRKLWWLLLESVVHSGRWKGTTRSFSKLYSCRLCPFGRYLSRRSNRCLSIAANYEHRYQPPLPSGTVGQTYSEAQEEDDAAKSKSEVWQSDAFNVLEYFYEIVKHAVRLEFQSYQPL